MHSRLTYFWGPAIAAVLLAGHPARAWDEDGHAIITYLAIEALPSDMPSWLKTPQATARLVYLSSEPDRWRGQHNRDLDHINGPEHYIDVESLGTFGLSLQTLPTLRRRFTDLWATRGAIRAAQTKDSEANTEQKEAPSLPGLLPYRIAEVQWTIAASWTQLRTYERHADRVSESMIENARRNIIYHMGILSHYVGDGAQPLHLTHHHHGWVGPNPGGFTTERSFHSYIDSGVIRRQEITFDELRGSAKPPRKISTERYWQAICGYLNESHCLVEPLYELHKKTELTDSEGKRFIEERLLTAGSALAGFWVAAVEGSTIDEFRVRRLLERYPKEPGRKPRSDLQTTGVDK